MTSSEPGDRIFPDAEVAATAGNPAGAAIPKVSLAISPETIAIGLRLDANHTPETNGWMAVCRRCGIRTDGPDGAHAPHALQIATAESWLDHDALGSSIARLKSKRDT
jgi:hypothetical protein